MSQNYRFTGKEHDAESGLENFEARYDASSIGRFMTPDDGSDQSVGDPQSWNLYAYVRNQPLRYVDPTGHGDQEATAAASSCAQDQGEEDILHVMSTPRAQRRKIRRSLQRCQLLLMRRQLPSLLLVKSSVQLVQD